MNWDILTGLLTEIWALTVKMAPFLLFGFLIAGVLHVLIPDEKVYEHLSGGTLLAVVKASIFGVPLPLCSCGVIPVAAHIRRQGASKGATVSFLTSTPTTGIDSIFATYSLLGLVFAIARPVAAFVSGIAAGIATNFLNNRDENRHPVDNGGHCETCRVPDKSGSSVLSKVKSVISYGFGELVEDVAKWLVIGIVAGGVISFLVPENFFAKYLGNPLIAYPLVLAIATPMYVCATGSIPIAAALVAKGLTPGAALVFLIAGPATNTATLSFVGGKLGKRTLLAYLSVVLLTAFAFGLILDGFFKVEATQAVLSAKKELIPSWLSSLSAIFLFLLVLRALALKFIPQKFGEVRGMGIVIKVPDMSCRHCVMTIERAVKELDGVESVAVDLETKLVEVEGDVPIEKVKEAVRNAGYTPEIPLELSE